MRRTVKLAALGAVTLLIIGLGSGYAFADEHSNTPKSGTSVSSNADGMAAAPYLYMGWADPPSPKAVQEATGASWFTLAFVLSDGGCAPAWDGQRPLGGDIDEKAIKEIRDGGGDVIPSIGGWSGNKLGPACSSAEDLAAAYQKVIDAYDLKAIDIDIENTDEFENEAVQDRILGALKIVKENNENLKTVVTFGTAIDGPNSWGERLIDKSKELGSNIDVFTVMPFDFGGSDMYADTISAAEGLRDKLKGTFGWDDAEAYKHLGLSGMNGISDQSEETTVDTWTKVRDWASDKSLGRLTFWSVNRDRPCPDTTPTATCSGTDQEDWQFTKITAGL